MGAGSLCAKVETAIYLKPFSFRWLSTLFPLVRLMIKSTLVLRSNRKYPVKLCKCHIPEGWAALQNWRWGFGNACAPTPPPSPKLPRSPPVWSWWGLACERLPQAPTLGWGALHVVFQSELELFQIIFCHGHLALHEHDVLWRDNGSLQSHAPLPARNWPGKAVTIPYLKLHKSPKIYSNRS